MTGSTTTELIGAKEVERYKKWFEKRGRTLTTQYTMCGRLQRFFTWVAEYRESKGRALTKISDITWKDFDAYREGRLKEVSGNTVKTEMNIVISYYKMRYETTLKDKELNRYNKIKAVPKPVGIAKDINHFKYMKISDIDILIATAKELRHVKPYTLLSEAYEFVMVLLYTGQRAEIYGLKVDEIDFKSKRINFRTKGGKLTEMWLHPDLEKILKKHLKDRPYKSDFVFKLSKPRSTVGGVKYNSFMAYRTITRLGSKAGLENIHPHRFRKSVGSYLRHMGLDLKIIQKILGHADFSMTANLYTEVSFEDVENAFKGISFIGNGEVRPEKLEALQKIANMDPETLKKLIAVVEAL